MSHSRPILIGIAGAHGGAGKTTVACEIIRALPGATGAIKCTPTHLYSAVSEDPSVLTQKGKDTARYLEAGAAAAIWVQSTHEDLPETIGAALGKLSHLPVIVLEGNSAIEQTAPDIVIFIAGPEGRIKDSAAPALRMAHVIICEEGQPPEGAPTGARLFSRSDTGSYVKHIAGFVHERGR